MTDKDPEPMRVIVQAGVVVIVLRWLVGRSNYESFHVLALHPEASNRTAVRQRAVPFPSAAAAHLLAAEGESKANWNRFHQMTESNPVDQNAVAAPKANGPESDIKRLCW